jgi:2-iminobutanoate/2-iminopropanoate deaminase
MKTVSLLSFTLLLAACASHKPVAYHAGPWENEIGYSQAIRIGRTLHVAGTVGADASGFPKDVESQLKLAYASIEATLAAHGATLGQVTRERVFTLDIEALKKCQETRKAIYKGHLPAATWVEVRRLYAPEALLEIEVDVAL